MLLVFCLIPLFWYFGKGTAIINGVDTNFPLDPSVWINRRFFMWNNISNGGSDFSFASAGIFFHLVQFLPHWLGLGLQVTQKISLVFWFALIAFSSYVFSENLVKSKKILRLAFVVFYCLNVYMFNSWENVKVANLSLVATTPILLHVFLKIKNGEWSFFKGGVFAAIAGLVLSGAGINPAYFITFFIIYFIFALSFVFQDKNYLSIIKSFFFVTLIVLIVNTYWLLPTANFIFRSVTQSSSISSIGFNDWIDSLSKNTSILNIFRLQGAWDWYSFDSDTKTPLFLPYAVNYFDRVQFIIFSFALPTIAILSMFFVNKKKPAYYLAAIVMLILGVFLSSGTHPPTGVVYKWLSLHLPYFSLFRSPWYIFTPMVILAFSTLTVLFFQEVYNLILLKRLTKYKLGIDLLIVVLIVGNIVYCYPLVTGRVFRPGIRDGFFVNFPDYIFKAGSVLSDAGNRSRVIAYPDDHLEKFNWGYTGVEPVVNLFMDRETVFSGINNSDSGFSQIVKSFYENIKINHTESSINLAKKLNVDTILEKKDQQTLAPAILHSDYWTTEKYGEWLIHTFNSTQFQTPISKIYLGKTFYFGYPSDRDQANTLSLLDKDEHLLNPVDTIIGKINEYNDQGGVVVSAINSQKESHKKSISRKIDFSEVVFTFTIPESGNYKPALENYGLESASLDKFILLINGRQEGWAVERADTSYIYMVSRYFEKGDYTIKYKIKNNVALYEDFESGVYPFKKDTEGKMLSMTNESEKDVSIDFLFKNFDANRSYFVELDYQWDYGNYPLVIIDQRNSKTLFKSQLHSLDNNSNKMHLGVYYNPVQTQSDTMLSLVSPFSTEDGGTRVNYDNLTVHKLFTNNLYLVKAPSYQTDNAGEIKYKQISPVKYQGTVVDAKKHQTLILAENYSPEWRIKIKDMDGNDISFAANHFSIDTYANAWYIDTEVESYQFEIYYQPQVFFNIGVTVSMVSLLIISSTYLIYERRHKKKFN